jgi:hypothetical protein
MAHPMQSAVGMTDGRANALTVVLPLKWWGRWWLTFWLAVLRTRRGRRFAFESSLDPLRFISAIRWSLVGPFDPPKFRIFAERPESERWHLVFESNFDGDWDEYLDNFGAVMAKPLASIIRAGVGYPGLGTRGMFKAYAKAYDIVPEHYVSAYPTLAAGDIREELLARDPSGAARRRIIKDGFGKTEPQWSTFLMPIKPDRIGDAITAARDFDQMTSYGDDADVGATPLLVNGRVHFGRLVVINRPAGPWLLITMTHDGPIEPTMHELIARESEIAASVQARSRWRVLLEKTIGVPTDSDSWWDDERLTEHLLQQRPASARRALTYCGYPGTTVAEINTFVWNSQRLQRWPSPEGAS